MKIRNSFVSNSSSASFCIPRKELNNEQYKSILQYLINFNTDWWEICFTHRNVIGFTTMDNNDLHAWLKKG